MEVKSKGFTESDSWEKLPAAGGDHTAGSVTQERARGWVNHNPRTTQEKPSTNHHPTLVKLHATARSQDVSNGVWC